MASELALRPCTEADFGLIWAIINDGAKSYRGLVTADCLIAGLDGVASLISSSLVPGRD